MGTGVVPLPCENFVTHAQYHHAIQPPSPITNFGCASVFAPIGANFVFIFEKNAVTPSALEIDFVPTPWAGRIGMSACPGSRVGVAFAEEVLVADVECLVRHGIRTVVSLLGDDELVRLGAKNLPHQLALHGVAWQQLPVKDFGVPNARATIQWRSLLPDLTRTLESGPILVHCAYGKGRTGTMVATLFTAWGWRSEEAIAWVRQHRKGAIENPKQEAYVGGFT